MEFIEETTAINIFNPNSRKIKCIVNEHDYLGDGTVFCEDNLEKGKQIVAELMELTFG